MSDPFADPLRFLTECHGRIRLRLATFAQVASDLRTPAGAERSALAGALAFLETSGATHTQDEEESLFPRLATRMAEEVETLITEHRDHSAVEAELRMTLEALDPGLSESNALPDPAAPRIPGGTPAALRAADLLEKLVKAYEDHIPIEDNFLFPRAREVLYPEDLDAIASEMRARHAVGRKLV